MIDPRYPALSRAIVNSTLWRIGASIVAAMTRAWPDSLTAGLALAASPLLGVSQVAWVFAVAATIAFAIQFAIPVYVRSGLPIIWPLAAIVLMILIAATAGALRRAWPHSTVVRILTTPRYLR
jgi:hypothetical protein